ncbi:50S ribosomal protein L32e [Candidatus Woesearchaeota archaeon]|nr:50S ribosomal protein L32e [Candidatus Woesearchaeota archaeon]
MMAKLLELRKELKGRKPEFIRQDYGKRKKLSMKWRKPKGIHSKIRHHFKGRRKMPSPGYKSPLKARGLHSLGLKMVKVNSVEDLSKIKKENQGVVISKTVGNKKRYLIMKKAKELEINVLNLNIDEQIKKIEEFLKSKKGKIAEDRKEKPKEDKESKKEQKETEMTDEQKKEADKKEKDRVLIKRV